MGQFLIRNYSMPPEYRIKEKSFIAWLASKKLKTDNMAIVIGKTIHLRGVTKEKFLENKKWLKHELCHVKQFKQYGFFPFIYKYLRESMRKGYYDNMYEVEAREAELGE